MKRVRVSRPSSAVRTVDISDSATVREALRDAGYEMASNEVVQVNGTPRTLDYVPGDNDVIILAAGAKGNVAMRPKSKGKKAPAKKAKKATKK